MLTKPDEWFTLEVEARGNRLTTRVNGEPVSELVDPGQTYKKGAIVLQLLGPTVVQFKSIEIREMPPAPARDEDRLQGTWTTLNVTRAGVLFPPEGSKHFAVIFDGERMTWKLPGGKSHTGTFKLDATQSRRRST